MTSLTAPAVRLPLLFTNADPTLPRLRPVGPNTYKGGVVVGMSPRAVSLYVGPTVSPLHVLLGLPCGPTSRTRADTAAGDVQAGHGVFMQAAAAVGSGSRDVMAPPAAYIGNRTRQWHGVRWSSRLLTSTRLVLRRRDRLHVGRVDARRDQNTGGQAGALGDRPYQIEPRQPVRDLAAGVPVAGHHVEYAVTSGALPLRSRSNSRPRRAPTLAQNFGASDVVPSPIDRHLLVPFQWR